ncbi:MAG: amino acid ABC transporter permease, partial [Rhodoglobus sp.]
MTSRDDEARQPSPIELGRRAFRRRQGVRSVLVSIASTLVLAVAAWLFIVNTPGWARVQSTFFDPEVFVSALPRVWDGFLLNLRVLFFAVIGVFVVAVLIAIIRTLRGPV